MWVKYLDFLNTIKKNSLWPKRKVSLSQIQPVGSQSANVGISKYLYIYIYVCIYVF